MDWKTSNPEDGNELRTAIGLQFFAADGEGADTDGFETDFLAALNGEDGLEDQQTGEPEAGESENGGLEDQQGAEADSEPETDANNDGSADTQGTEPPAVTVPLVYNGQQILLPADAVQALTGALGANPVELLQKGMNYDRKGEREFRLLDQYAEASGLSRAQYIEQLERSQNEQLLEREIEKCRGEFPETPDAALRAIAEGRMATRRAEEQQKAQQRQAELSAMQQRIDQTVQQAKRQGEMKAWDDYEKIAGVQRPEDIPPRVMELVQTEGMTPTAAHWRYQAELNQQAVEIEKKNTKNRQTSPGSVNGSGEESGFDADFMRAFGY